MPDCKYAEVCLENTAFSFDKKYTYIIKEEDNSLASSGSRVFVPFGRNNKLKQGLILNIFTDEYKKGIKKINTFIDTEPILSHEMLMIIEWLKDNTFCCYYDAVKCMIPGGLFYNIKETYLADFSADTSSLSDTELIVYNEFCRVNKYVQADKVFENLGVEYDKGILEKLLSNGFLNKNVDFKTKINDYSVKYCRLTDEGLDAVNNNCKISTKQSAVLNFLNENNEISLKEVCYYTGVTSAVLKALSNKGMVELYDYVFYRNSFSLDYEVKGITDIILNSEQQTAYDNLLNQYKSQNVPVSLLYGVTGSGKTQVYLKLIDYVLSSGKQVIVMVPEISLTPQTLSIFVSRYGKRIAILHSGLTLGQRTDEWKRIKNNEVDIVIGTRSAVFAPLNNVGLIVIDEEQEHTYKSEQSPRYSAKDIAALRTKYNGGLLLLCSATPSIESYTKALNNQITLNTLKNRYSRSELPGVEIIDMYTDDLSESDIFSLRLINEIKDCISKQKQCILLLNRRGYNTYAKCSDCGNVITCPSCSISLTYHYPNNKLMCHYCGFSSDLSTQCTECNGNNISLSGFGTQRVEEELISLIPEAKVLRMDADTTFTKNSYNVMLSDFSEGKYDVLIGTQMVAKGHDFPNVTLVGVLNADIGLVNDDFRSQEKTFSLLTQVIGRAGRGEFNGKAIIQTNNPESEIISYSSKQDYDKFYYYEMSLRKSLIYPPFCNLFLIGFSSLSDNLTKKSAFMFLSILKTLLTEKYDNLKVIILGPAPARIVRINKKFRYRIILKGKNTKQFREMLNEAMRLYYSSSKIYSNVSVYLDINPENIV